MTASAASALRRTHLLRQLEEEGQQTVSAQTSFRDDTPEPPATPIIVHSYDGSNSFGNLLQHTNHKLNLAPNDAATLAVNTKTATILVSKAKTKTGLPLMLKSPAADKANADSNLK